MSDTGRCLGEVLVAAAGELADLAVVADQLGSTALADIERWQELDRLSQYLAGIAGFLTGLASTVPHVQPDLSHALSVLTTSDLADRLAGRTCQADVDSGALDLFDA